MDIDRILVSLVPSLLEFTWRRIREYFRERSLKKRRKRCIHDMKKPALTGAGNGSLFSGAKGERMTTFQILVQIGNETKSFITGANNYGEAVHAVEAHLEAGRERGEIIKVTPKKSIGFVPPLQVSEPDYGDEIPY